MTPRVITRTHYQVDEPAYLRVLIRDCSSPTRSDYPERVAARLEERLKSLRRDFNLPAAKYCVDLGRNLGLLTDNNFWSSSAHVLRLISSEGDSGALECELSPEEKVFYLRTFIEFDGAAVVFLARKALGAEKIPADGEEWNAVANDMMKSIYTSYLDIMTDVRDRATVRQLLAKRTRQPYGGKSGSHQCFVHLQTMARIGLLRANGREYRSMVNASGDISQGILRLVNSIPDPQALEDVISRKQWPQLAFDVFSGNNHRGGWAGTEILQQTRELYERVMATGVALCPLKSLIETIQIKQIAAGVLPVSYDECMVIYRKAQARAPNKIRFHVDRMGLPAFLVLS